MDPAPILMARLLPTQAYPFGHPPPAIAPFVPLFHFPSRTPSVGYESRGSAGGQDLIQVLLHQRGNPL